jgi:ribosomal protein S18 acetylase RimI-like enzyme
MQSLTLRGLDEDELPAAAAVLGDAMRDNPLHLRAFGEDPDRRERALRRLFESVLRRVWRKGFVEGATLDGRLVGVCGRLSPGNCRATLVERLAFLPALKKGNSWTTVARVFGWAGAWSRRDPDAPHWHLGPLGVLREEQGKGVGRRLLASFCARMDAERAGAYLETDKEINVRIYEKEGFTVSARQDVIGTPCWFLSRPPALPGP